MTRRRTTPRRVRGLVFTGQAVAPPAGFEPRAPASGGSTLSGPPSAADLRICVAGYGAFWESGHVFGTSLPGVCCRLDDQTMDPIIACTALGCGLLLTPSDERCPECGSRDRHILDSDQITLVEQSRLKKRDGEPGKIRPYAEHYDEARWNGDRSRVERRVMVVDRSTNFYSQEWSDLVTGEVVFTKSGALDDPDIHGESARRKLKPRADEEDDPAT